MDACKDKIKSRKKIFSQFDSNNFNAMQGKQFSDQFQKNRSKKKIGKRKVTPLYSNYNKNTNQVDEIFIILKEDDKDELLNLDNDDTHLIYDSFVDSNRKSTDSDPIKGLTFNLKNESLIDLPDEKLTELSNPSSSNLNSFDPNLSNRETLKSNDNESSLKLNNKLIGLRKSNEKLNVESNDKSNDKSNYDQLSSCSVEIKSIDNHGILPVHEMVKHWTQTSNDSSRFNDSKLIEPKSKAIVEMPNLSNIIKNKKAIFEKACSGDSDKENKPKKPISSSFSFRKKQFDNCSENKDQSEDRSDDQIKVNTENSWNKPKSQFKDSSDNLWIKPKDESKKLYEEQSKDTPDNFWNKSKLKELNQQSTKVDKFRYFNLWNKNDDNKTDNKTDNKNDKKNDKKNENNLMNDLNGKKNKFKDFNQLINDKKIEQSKGKQANGHTIEPVRELIKVNVKQKKNFWESLIVKKKVCYEIR